MKLKLALVLLVGSVVCLAQAESVMNAKPGVRAADAKISAAKAELETGMKPYVRVSGGIALLNDSDLSVSGVTIGEAEFDPGYVIGVAAGVVLTNGTDMALRLEAELGYQENDLDELTDPFALGIATDNGKATIMTLMLNSYIDFKNKSIITPYLMAGIGAANADIELDGDSEDETVFAGQFGAGLAFAVSENVSIDTEYRYFRTESPEFDGVEAEISGHRLQVGVRYTFN